MKKLENALWSDESKFKLYAYKRRVYVKRKPGEKRNDEWVLPSVKHASESANGVGLFWGRDGSRFDSGQGNHEKEKYHSILQKHAIQSGYWKSKLGKNIPFSTRQQLKTFFWIMLIKRKIILNWPSQSPRFSLIEQVWYELERRVWKEYPKSESELF